MSKNEFINQEKENKKIEKQREKEMKRREKEEEKEFKNKVKQNNKNNKNKKDKKNNKYESNYNWFTRIIAAILCLLMLLSVCATLISVLIAG